MVSVRPFVRQGGVALGAEDIDMLAGQWIFGLRVIELCGRFPSGCVVTIVAGSCDLPAMFIEMATDAGLVKPEEGGAEGYLINSQSTLVLDELFGVAGTALDRGMFPLELVTGERVVEFILSVFPIDQVICPSLMFHVAGLALGVILRAVQARVNLHFVSDNGMAREALVRDQLAPGAVALAAVLHTFEESVGLVQLTRRDLSHYR